MTDSRCVQNTDSVKSRPLSFHYLFFFLLSACSSERAPGHTAQGTYKVGTPYQIEGTVVLSARRLQL